MFTSSSQYETARICSENREPGTCLSAVPDMHHIPILHDVVLAFEAQRALGAGVGFGTRFQQLIPANGLGSDEMLFQIGVNGSGAVLRLCIRWDCPGAALVFSGGEERNQSQQVIAFADQARESAFYKSIAAKKFCGVLVGHLG